MWNEQVCKIHKLKKWPMWRQTEIESKIVNYDEVLKETTIKNKKTKSIIQLDGNKLSNLKLIGMKQKLEDNTDGVWNILIAIIEENFPNRTV